MFIKSNGLVKNGVRNFKNGLKKILGEETGIGAAMNRVPFDLPNDPAHHHGQDAGRTNV
jgi:hypothetical protein